MLEARLGIELSGSEFAGVRVPGEDGLGPRATRRRAHAQDVLESLRIVPSVESPGKACAFVEHAVRQVDKPGDFQRVRCRASAKRWLELEGADAAAADVAEPVNRVEGLRAPSGFRQPCVDQARA